MERASLRLRGGSLERRSRSTDPLERTMRARAEVRRRTELFLIWLSLCKAEYMRFWIQDSGCECKDCVSKLGRQPENGLPPHSASLGLDFGNRESKKRGGPQIRVETTQAY